MGERSEVGVSESWDKDLSGLILLAGGSGALMSMRDSYIHCVQVDMS